MLDQFLDQPSELLMGAQDSGDAHGHRTDGRGGGLCAIGLGCQLQQLKTHHPVDQGDVVDAVGVCNAFHDQSR